jgi:glycerol transport system ATP-binding protein
MNVLPATFDNGVARFAGHRVEIAAPLKQPATGARLEIGVRPEFVRFAEDGIPVRIRKVADSGRYRIVEATADADGAATIIKVLVAEATQLPSERAFLRFEPAYTQLYVDGWIAG